jgi:Asp-tRNA(Asn)/Glu-tRNA(Gln) amidotransferase A subunit family amidase
MVPMAHATDGGGSIRVPASCCGLFGLKTTRARTPYGPDLGEGWSGASVGHAVTRTVRDSAALLDATQAMSSTLDLPAVLESLASSAAKAKIEAAGGTVVEI